MNRKIVALVLVTLGNVIVFASGYEMGHQGQHVIRLTTDQVTSFNDGWLDGKGECGK